MVDGSRTTRFTRYLVETHAFKADKMVVVDVGARGGFSPAWDVLQDQVRLIGFEPDTEECDRLNADAAGTSKEYYPAALHRDKGRRTFYVTAFPSSSGFTKPDAGFYSRFPDERNMAVEETTELDTTSLDAFAEEHGIGSVDFLKIDVEGSDLDVLQGSAHLLDRSVLGVAVEVEWDRVRDGQAPFADVDSYLRSLGFTLFNLVPARLARKVLSPKMFSTRFGNTPSGQVVWGNALYLRDAVKDQAESPAEPSGRWSETRVLKLAALMEQFDLSDCAVELLLSTRTSHLVQRDDVDHLVDLLVPTVRGQVFSYDEYLAHLRSADSGGLVRSNRILYLLTRKYVPRILRRVGRRFLMKCRTLIDRMLDFTQ